jgi:hypothetical protein
VSHRRSRHRRTVTLHTSPKRERCGCWLHRLVGPDYPCSRPDLVMLRSFPGMRKAIGADADIPCAPSRDSTPCSTGAPQSERRCILAADPQWLKTGAHTLLSRGPTPELTHSHRSRMSADNPTSEPLPASTRVKAGGCWVERLVRHWAIHDRSLLN